MIKRKFWDEIKNEWPKMYWDEYFRNPNITKNRTCIYPEIPRVENFGIIGVSGKEYFKKYVYPIKKNTHSVDYSKVIFL